MLNIVVDFETFYTKDYSLSKMTPVEYILDPRFDVHGCAIKIGTNPARYYEGETSLVTVFNKLKQHQATVISHNALFDMSILAWWYGWVPDRMLDTLGMARALLGHELPSLSLGKVAAHLGLGSKDTEALTGTMGLTPEQMRQNGLYHRYVDYAINDAELCAAIFARLILDFPEGEQEIMDSVIRCAVKPKLLLDQGLLCDHLAEVKRLKHEQLVQAGIQPSPDGKPPKELMSANMFAGMLRDLGVEPPVKTSPATGLVCYAFAKTDQGMIELSEHPDPRVQALVAARTGHKSTLEEARTQRFINIANLVWPLPGGYLQGKMPIPLKYGGAHTHRLSGDWKLNLQNLPRGGKLRRALIAPPGHQVVAADLSQIEARIVPWISGQEDLVEQFANGEDVYSSFASFVFNREVSRKTPVERWIGKTCILGMGYGVGPPKFQATVEVQSKLQLGQTIKMGIGEATGIVQAYRTRFDRIPATWRLLQTGGISALTGGTGAFTLGPCEFTKERIGLPSGLHLHYRDLRQEGDEWVFQYGKLPKRIYGGALMENIVQALARIVVMDAAMRLKKRFNSHGAGIELALQVHDELVYVVPDKLVDVVKKIIEQEMTRRPAWAPTLPVAVEVHSGPSYGDAK